MDELTLRTKEADKQKTFNFGELDQYFREIKNELYMKRNEVSKLKTDLELANQENHKLTASLDKLKKSSEENQITMDLFIKKSKEFEPKYYEKRDALIKLELQYKIAISKTDALREDLQRVTIQKAQLIRKVDVLEDKQKRDSLYSNEISQKLIQLKSTVATVTEEMGKLKNEHVRAANLSQQVDIATETLQKCEGLSKLNRQLKEENAILEEQSISFKAKFEKLNEFLNNNSISKEPDLQGRALLSQCKKISAFYKKAMETKNGILTDLNKHLREEKATNLKLIKENEKLRNKLTCLEKVTADLQTKLSVYVPTEMTEQEIPVKLLEVIDVKAEPDETIIEIIG